jgi:predicted DNA-binding transcriptional regulator AlpA
MSDTERQPAAQVAMARKAAKLRAENEQRRQQQRHRPPESSGRDHRRRQQRAACGQDTSRTEASDGEAEDDDGPPDSLLPDAQVAKELGITVMSLWRRTNDPDEDFPAPIKIRNRNFRSRKQLEAYKKRKLRKAMRTHHARLNVRRLVPIPEPELEPSNTRSSTSWPSSAAPQMARGRAMTARPRRRTEWTRSDVLSLKTKAQRSFPGRAGLSKT